MKREIYDRWCFSLLLCAAALGLVSMLLVHSVHGIFRPSLGRVSGWALALCTALLPLCNGLLVRFLHSRRGVSLQRARRIHAVEWVPLLFVRPDAPHLFLMASLAIMTAHTFARSTRSAVAPWTLAGGLALNLVGAATTPSVHWMWITPLTLTVVVSALVLLHVRRGFAHHEALEKWSFMERRESTTHLPSPGRLALQGLPFVALTLVAVPLISFAIVALPVPMSEARRLSSGRPRPAETTREANNIAATSRVAFDGVFPSDLSYGQGVARLQHELVMIVTPPAHVSVKEFRARGPYYLRGLVQDRFTRNGADYGGGGRLREFSANDEGWIRLQAQEPEAVLELDIYQHPLLTREDSWNILFSTQPALAVRAGKVLFEPDGVLVSLDGDREWKRYSTRSGVNDARYWKLQGISARHPDPRTTQLPPRSAQLDELRARAERITADADTDLERVNAVLAHFHSQFAYSLQARDTPGLTGVIDFLDRKRGHCTGFASASALLLRSVGIPARVATGFLADTWSEESGGYVVTTRDGHAWLEVFFEGVGWLRCEPTPSNRREQARRAFLAEGELGLSTWFDELGTDLSYWLSSGADETDLGLVMQTLGSGPDALWASARRSPMVAAAWLVGLIGLWVWLVRRRKTPGVRRTHTSPREVQPEENLYARILQTLERRGYPRRPGQTAREYAREVSQRLPEWKGLIEATESFYRARFGGEQLRPEETEQLEALCERAAAPVRS